MVSVVSGAVAAVAAVLSAAAFVAGHLVMSFDISEQSISDMVHGDAGWLIRTGIALTGVATAATGIALIAHGSARPAGGALLIAAVGAGLAAGFTSPAPELTDGHAGSGTGHVVGVAIATVALVAAFWLGWRAWRQRDGWRLLGAASGAVAVALILGWALRWLLQDGGTVERVVTGLVLVVICATGLRVVAAHHGSSGRLRVHRAAASAAGG